MTIQKDKTSKHIPVRTCIVCGRKRDKNELIRLILAEALALDSRRNMPGRGIYICDRPTCIEKLRNVNTARRAFRMKDIPGKGLSEIVDMLIEGFK